MLITTFTILKVINKVIPAREYCDHKPSIHKNVFFSQPNGKGAITPLTIFQSKQLQQIFDIQKQCTL